MQNLSLLSAFLCYFCALIVAQNEIMLRIKKIRYIYPKELFDALYRYFFHLSLHLHDASFYGDM